MTLGLFQAMLADFCGVGFTIDSTRLLQIINMARDRIQRNYNLSFAKKVVQATYPATAGTGYALPADFKSFCSTKAVSLYNTDLGKWIPMSGITQTQLETGAIKNDGTFYQYYVQALTTTTMLFIEPEPLSASIQFRYNCWLDPYSSSATEDFLLKYGTDVLLYECLKIINLFRQDEEQIQINAAASAQALAELEAHVANLENNGASIGGY